MKMLLLLFLVPTAVFGQCLTSGDNKSVSDLSAWINFHKAQEQFAINMLNILNDVSPTENILFSPFSVFSALILAYFIANNHTEQVLKKALFIPPSQTKVSTMKAYVVQKRLFQFNNSSSDFELLLANRLFVSSGLSVIKCMQDLFKEEIVKTNFSTNPKAALQMINNWVVKQTKNQIKDLLSEEQIAEATKIVLANAAYFKGYWRSKFRPKATSKDLFYITNSQNAYVMMMKQKSRFNHLISEKLGAHVVELPYKGGRMSLFIFLPPFTSPNVITNILRRLKTQNFYKMIYEDMIERPVDVSIPKFSIEQELQLLPILNSMNIGELFSSSADLSGLTGSPELKLDDIVHKAKITLDEEGTTASAATAIFNFRSSRPRYSARFICNHPFVYILYDKKTKTILFTGIYNKPPPS